MGSHRRRNGRGRRVAVFFLYALGKERKEALARKRSPNQVRRDGWLGEGLEEERCSLVGLGSNYTICRALVCFSPSLEKLIHWDAQNLFLGDYGNAKGYKIIISDEVSSLQLCGHRLLCCARILQWKSRGGEKTREEKSLLGNKIFLLTTSLCCSAKPTVAGQK